MSFMKMDTFLREAEHYIHIKEEPLKEEQRKILLMKKLFKKYAAKKLISRGEDALAPTKKQWENISQYHQGKVLHHRTHPVLTRRGYVTDEAKIRKHEELKNFALELYDIAKKIAEKCEEQKMTRILVLKEGTQEDQPYKQRKKSVTLKTQEAHSADPGRLRSGTVYKDLHDDTEEECDVEATQRRRIKGKMLRGRPRRPFHG
ncbi:unnamed protein product [Knipowitschia caucasica]